MDRGEHTAHCRSRSTGASRRRAHRARRFPSEAQEPFTLTLVAERDPRRRPGAPPRPGIREDPLPLLGARHPGRLGRLHPDRNRIEEHQPSTPFGMSGREQHRDHRRLPPRHDDRLLGLGRIHHAAEVIGQRLDGRHVGGRNRSERPVPRRSVTISRRLDARPRRKRAYGSLSLRRSRFVGAPASRTRSQVPPAIIS